MMPTKTQIIAEITNAWADIDADYKPSQVVDAIRQDILTRLEARRGKTFGEVDRALMLFDELVAATQRTIKRGRDC